MKTNQAWCVGYSDAVNSDWDNVYAPNSLEYEEYEAGFEKGAQILMDLEYQND